MGVVTGGLPGAGLLLRLAIVVSDDTVLRLVKLPSPVESYERPSAIGRSVNSRDGSGLYTEGADWSAPIAQRVADRFHLVLESLGGDCKGITGALAPVAASSLRARQSARTCVRELAAD